MVSSEVISVDVIREALMGRWDPKNHVHVHEAPERADRSGRRLDVLIVNCWRTHGLARIGVEIKRSMPDFRNELKEPGKADWWVERTNEFWIAAPALVARKIELSGELPLAWGLLAVSDKGRCRTVKAAPERADPLPLDFSTVVGALRSLSGASVLALDRAHRQGYDLAVREMDAAKEGRGRPPSRLEPDAEATAWMKDAERQLGTAGELIRRALHALTT